MPDLNTLIKDASKRGVLSGSRLSPATPIANTSASADASAVVVPEGAVAVYVWPTQTDKDWAWGILQEGAATPLKSHATSFLMQADPGENGSALGSTFVYLPLDPDDQLSLWVEERDGTNMTFNAVFILR